MNILELKRSARGYFFREGGDEQNYPTTAPSTLGTYQGDDESRYVKPPAPAPVVVAPPVVAPPPAVTPSPPTVAAGVARNGPSAGQQLAAVIGRTGGGGPNVDIPVTEYIEGYESVNPDGTINRYDTQGNFVTTYTSNGSDIVGDFFAGIDSSLGLSSGLTSIGKALEDLDNALGLSKNAPAIVGAAAAYFLPGVGAAIGQSLVSSGVITGAAIPYATTIGTALAQTGVSVAQGKPLNEAITNAIISGGVSGLTQAFGADVKSAIAKITENPIAQKAIFKAGTDVVTAVAQGKSRDEVLQGIGRSIVSTVANSAATEAVKNIPGINSLSPAQQNIVKSGIATSIQGGDGTKSMLNAAITEGTNYALDATTQTARENAAQEARESTARENAAQAARDAAAQEARDTAARDAAAQEAREATARETAAQATRDQTARDQAARDQASREAAAYAQTIADQAAREATEQTTREQAAQQAREAASREAAAQTAREQAAQAQAQAQAAQAAQAAQEARDRAAADQADLDRLTNSGLKETTPSPVDGIPPTTSYDPEWGDLQGAIDAATARGINAKAPTFSEAFSSWRTALGANGTFPWTDPKTGVTKVFTTDYAPATVAAISADPSAEATANPKLNTYVLGKLLDSQNIKSADFNPADLSGIEMASFFQNYIKATPEQQSRLLNGSDASTYKVFDKLIKETAAVNPTGALAPLPYAGTGSIQEDPSTHYVDVAKAGLSLAASDLASLGVRGLQVVGGALGLDTPTLQQTQKLLTDDKNKTLSTLVGYEKSVAGGIASGIESATTFLIGGPYASVATLTGIAANSSWLEGVEKNLSTEDNAKRTAVMTAAELVGEMLGVPGLKQVMKGIPVTGSVNEIIAAFKRQGAGLLNEEASELLTTTMQFAADKFASFGITPNATYADFVDALKDTVVATAAGVGTSGSIATSARSLNNAIESGAATDRTPVYPSIVSTDSNSPNKPVNTVSEIATAFADTGLPITSEVLNDFATTPKSELAEKATAYADPFSTDESEAREIARELGYTNPSQQLIDSLVGQTSEADTTKKLDAVANAQKMMSDLGLDLSDQDAISLANKITASSDTTDIDEFLDRFGVTTEGSNTTPKPGDANDFLNQTGVTTGATGSTGTVLSTDPANNTALVVNSSGATTVVDNTNNTLKVGDTVPTTPATTPTATPTTTPTTPNVVDDLVKSGLTETATPATTTPTTTPTATQTTSTPLTTEQKNKIISDAITKTPSGSSSADIANAINTAALGTKLTDAENRLDAAIQSAKAIGLQGDAALQSGLNTVAADLGIAKTELLTQLGKSENDLRNEFQTGLGGVTTDIAKTRTDLTAAIEANEAAGLTRDQATQKAINDVAGQLGTTKADLLTQLGTTEAALSTQIAGVKTDLSSQLNAQGKLFMDSLVQQGMNQQEALETAIAAQTKLVTEGQTATQTALGELSAAQQQEVANRVAAGQATDAAIAAVKATVKTGQAATQTALGELSAAQQKEVADRVAAGQETNAAIADVKATVKTGQAATQTALGELSAAQQKEVADRVAAGEETNAAIAAVQSAVETGQAALESKLTTQGKEFMDALVAQGMDQKTALETAMAAQTQQLTELSTGITTQFGEAEKQRQADITAAATQRQADLDAAAAAAAEAEKQRLATAAEVERQRQLAIADQKAREAANLKTIQTGQIRGQMMTGLQGLMGGLQQQATQMAAPAQVETVKATPGFSFDSPLNVGFFGGYESQKAPTKDKESLKIATGGYLDDLLEAIR